MTSLQFPLRFLDAVQIENDDIIYYVVGLLPSWDLKCFIVWLMTAPNGIETWAPLDKIKVISDESNNKGRLPFLKAMKITSRKKLNYKK